MNPRSIKRLLEILLDSIEKEGLYGYTLYNQINGIYKKYNISYLEKVILIKYIDYNKNEYFERKDKQIMIKWLKKQIKKQR